MSVIIDNELATAASVVPPRRRRTSELNRRAGKAQRMLSSPWASGIALLIALLWTVPTLGVFISSVRPEADVKSSGWWTFFPNPQLTLDNYNEVLFGSSTSLATFLLNSLITTVPSVVIPITIALLASYALAWIPFRGRGILFLGFFVLQVVPLQIALVPLLEQFVQWNLAGSFWTVWLAHTIFALPLAIFLLHNFMRDIPEEIMESARLDGAGHVTIFVRILLPLMAPAIAAFGIFQFLWVWNDLLVALSFTGGTANVAPLTVRVAELVGSRGSDWHLLTAGAFVSMLVPVIVFLALQRYFVRGLLAGSVKG